MESIKPGNIHVHISIKLEQDADTEAIQSSTEKVREEITQKYQGTINSAKMRRELQNELGDRLRNLAGVESVLVTTPLTSNPSSIIVEWEINLDTGKITSDIEFAEGDPVRRPPWATER